MFQSINMSYVKHCVRYTCCSDSVKCSKTDRRLRHSIDITQKIQGNQQESYLRQLNAMSLNIEHAFHLLKTKLKAERPTDKQQLKATAVKAWQSNSREETQHLVMTMTSRLQVLIDLQRIYNQNNV